MNLPEVAARVSLPLAAVISILLARRSPSYTPVAETLLLAASFDVARGLLVGTAFDPPLLLAFPCLSASLALRVLAKLPRWPVALAWAILAGLTLSEASRPFLGSVERLYGAVHGVGLLVQMASVWVWARRSGCTRQEHNPRATLRDPAEMSNRYPRDPVQQELDSVGQVDRRGLRFHDRDHAPRTVSDRSDPVAPLAVLLLLAGDLAALFGPFATGNPHRDWYVTHAQTVVLLAVFNVWQVVQVRELGSSFEAGEK